MLMDKGGIIWFTLGYVMVNGLSQTHSYTDGIGCHAKCLLHIRSNLGCSNLLKDTLTCSSAPPVAGICPPTIQSPANLLYPLSYNRPQLFCMYCKYMSTDKKAIVVLHLYSHISWFTWLLCSHYSLSYRQYKHVTTIGSVDLEVNTNC